MLNKNIIIIGPTASHKSFYAHMLSKKLNLSCWNMDSKQFFKDLSFLTSADNYNLSKILTPSETPSLGWFWNKIKRESPKILVGGSVFYAYNIIQGINIFETSENTTNFIKKHNAYNLLNKLYPHHNISPNDLIRINRNLESIIETGYPLYKQHKIEKISNPYVINIINHNLYSNIVNRLNQSWDQIVKEVHNFNCFNTCPLSNSFQSIIGFKEITEFLNENISLEDCKKQIITKTYQYAKYQIKFIKNKFIKNNLINETIDSTNLK